MYCIWKWSFRPRVGQISCFGVILAKISRRTCDRDSHLFQATICGGVQGHARDHCIKETGFYFRKFWREGAVGSQGVQEYLGSKFERNISVKSKVHMPS